MRNSVQLPKAETPMIDTVSNHPVQLSALIFAFLLFGIALAIAASIPRARASRLMEQGNALVLTGAERDGLELMERAIALQPKSIEYTRHLSYAYAAVGDIEAAFSYQKKILELDPGNPDALYDIARLGESV